MRLFPDAEDAPVKVTRTRALDRLARPETLEKPRTPLVAKAEVIVPALVPEERFPIGDQATPSGLNSQNWFVNPVAARCAVSVTEILVKPEVLSLKMADLPLAVVLSTASAAGDVVTAERPFEALTPVPVNAFNSREVVAEDTQLLEPCVPSKKSVPDPKLAAKRVGCAASWSATAVPPVFVVWKSHPAMSVTWASSWLGVSEARAAATSAARQRANAGDPRDNTGP